MADIRFIGTAPNNNTLINTWNDIQFDRNDVKLISGVEYAKQKVIKILTTAIGSDFYAPGYGTTLESLINTNFDDPGTSNAIVNTIIQALNYAEAQETSTDPAELVQSIDEVSVQADAQQSTIYVRITITLQNNQNMQIVFTP